MPLIVVLIALLLPIATNVHADDGCRVCHAVELRGIHAGLDCASCHGEDAGQRPPGAALSATAIYCQECHPDTLGVLHGPMAHRQAEQDFVARSWGQADPDFYQKNCAQCHVRTCTDCHGLDGHDIARPTKEDCHACHRGYYVGADYYGYAPREDAQRYQRGLSYGGEHYLKMRPDVHARAGMACGDCHDMNSLAQGRTASRTCLDCHEPDPEVIEHGIAAHMQKFECYACHSGWAPQQYATFFIRFTDGEVPDYFILRRDRTAPDYVRSAYLRFQNLPPLGISERGRVSPIRPQFQAYFSEISADGPVGEPNRKLAAQWKAFFPHTIQRGTPMCDQCHDNPQRFLLQKPEDRIYRIDEDGLGLQSFWMQEGQTLVNGSFYDTARYERMSRRDGEYVKAYVEKWKRLTESVGASSQP